MTRKTVQAIKLSASWTPNAETSAMMAGYAFGLLTPIRFAGGRILVRAAVATDYTDPGHAARVATRLQEILSELASTGTVHGTTTQAGAVPADQAERLPALNEAPTPLLDELPPAQEPDDATADGEHFAADEAAEGDDA